MSKYTFEEIKDKLYSGILCDILDQMGFRHQYLGPEMNPLLPETVVCGGVYGDRHPDVFHARKPPYGPMRGLR